MAQRFQLSEVVNNDIDAKLLREQNEDIRGIERDVADLAEVGTELNMLVEEQGKGLDEIENTTIATEEHVIEGHSQLAEAAMLACKARWKMLCIILIGLLIVLIVVAVIAVAVGIGAGIGSKDN